MPVKLPQLSPLPESQDEAQPGLKQTQGGLAHVVDQLLLARSNDIGPPQQQPGIDQRQGQQQARQAVGIAPASGCRPEYREQTMLMSTTFLWRYAIAVASAVGVASGLVRY